MFLMYYLNETGARVYTLKKEIPNTDEHTISAHPARFSPDDKYSRERVIFKQRFGYIESPEESKKSRLAQK